MPIIQNCEIWFLRANPKRPNARFNKTNPTWECQVRTRDKSVKKKWDELHLNPKSIIPEDETPPYYQINLRKKSIKKDGTPASPVAVFSGNLTPIDPDTVGNGSIAHVRVFQYEYPKADGSKGTATVMMGLQIIRHIHFKQKPRNDEFEMTETEDVPYVEDDEPGEPTVGAPSPAPAVVTPVVQAVVAPAVTLVPPPATPTVQVTEVVVPATPAKVAGF
jgi:hypothetical protein